LGSAYEVAEEGDEESEEIEEVEESDESHDASSLEDSLESVPPEVTAADSGSEEHQPLQSTSEDSNTNDDLMEVEKAEEEQLETPTSWSAFAGVLAGGVVGLASAAVVIAAPRVVSVIIA